MYSLYIILRVVFVFSLQWIFYTLKLYKHFFLFGLLIIEIEKSLKRFDLKEIKMLILDVDGVLTDGTVILDSSGEMIRTMHTKDGYALQHAIKKGYHIIVIMMNLEI